MEFLLLEFLPSHDAIVINCAVMLIRNSSWKWEKTINLCKSSASTSKYLPFCVPAQGLKNVIDAASVEVVVTGTVVAGCAVVVGLTEVSMASDEVVDTVDGWAVDVASVTVFST